MDIERKLNELVELVKAWIDRVDADGCVGCVFLKNTEEWEMPCRKCKRACKDYWRAKNG